MGTLGHKIFVPLNKTAPVVEDTADTPPEEMELFFTRTIKKLNFTVEASAKQTAEGFVVLKGSKIAPSSGADDTISPGNRKKREECKVIDNILQEDVLFTSPSSAAEFVTGKSCNGWVSWKTKDGKSHIQTQILSPYSRKIFKNFFLSKQLSHNMQSHAD